MNQHDENDTANTTLTDATRSTSAAPEGHDETRRPYVAPRVTKKRSVARVTLFSGGGATAGGLTATG